MSGPFCTTKVAVVYITPSTWQKIGGKERAVTPVLSLITSAKH